MVVKQSIYWLTRNAPLEGARYTDHIIPGVFQPEGYQPAWCANVHLLRTLYTSSYKKFAMCILASIGGCTYHRLYFLGCCEREHEHFLGPLVSAEPKRGAGEGTGGIL